MSTGQRKAKRGKGAEKKAESVVKEAEKEVEKVEKAIKKEVKELGHQKSKAAMRPSGRVPEATVMSRNGTEMISRRGRGFSHAELKGAGVEARLAAKWGVSVDPRRRTVLDENVSSLKQWSARPGAVTSAKAEVRSMEVRAEEVAKEVEEDVEIIEEEAVKAARAVKKGAKKVEGRAKKADKPKPRKKKGKA